MATAPYCNVSVVQEPANPTKPNAVQRIPQNSTLNQVINYVNNNFFAMKGNFHEQQGSRQTKITRIFNPSDSTQFVDVQEVVGLTFINPLTGQTLTWRR